MAGSEAVEAEAAGMVVVAAGSEAAAMVGLEMVAVGSEAAADLAMEALAAEDSVMAAVERAQPH